MARRISIPSKHVELKIVGPKDAFMVSRVQRLTANADIPTNTVDELGNSLHAGTSQDIPNVTLTFQLMDVGIKAIATLCGVDPSAYPPTGVDVCTSSKELDAVVYVKDASISDYIKTMHLQRCQLQSFAFNYTVDGDSTEEYTAVGSAKRWFTKDVVVEKFTAPGVGPFALSFAPIALKNGRDALSVISDGVYLTEVAAVPAAGEYEITASNVTLGAAMATQLLVVYQCTQIGNNWSDISETLMPAAIRGKDVPILIGVNSIERAQSVVINGAFNPIAVREMGNRDLVGYTSNVPEVTGTITVLDTDTQLLRLLTGASITDTEFQAGTCAASGVSLTVKLLDPTDCVAPYTVLKTVYLSSISVTSDGFTSNVNNNAEQTFNWRSDNGSVVVYSGAIMP